MASPFAEAITQSMISGLDPMNGVVRQYAQQTLETQTVDLVERKAEAISRMETMVAEAKTRQAPPSVINAYEKLLAKLSS